MRGGARFSILLLVVAYAVAGLPRSVAHEPHLDSHEAASHAHHEGEGDAEGAALQILLHGHAHPDGTPQHSHRVAPTIPIRPEHQGFQPPTDLGLPAAAAVEPPIQARFEPDQQITLPGAGPPSRLHWLCTLLI